MNISGPAPDLTIWSMVWLASAIYLLARHWREGRGVGLVLTYVMTFGAIHWMASALYLLPWYSGSGENLIAEGARQTGLAMLAFTIGGEIVAAMIRYRERHSSTKSPHPERSGLVTANPSVVINPQASNLLFLAGAVLYFGIAPIAGKIPTLNALITSGSTLVIVAVGIKCWNAWHTDRRGVIWMWLLASAVFPFVTVATQGFLGYGMAAFMTIAAFVAAFYGPRWKVVLFGALMGYVGLSVYVTYMRDRSEIRSMVRSGSALQDRYSRVTGTLGSIEWFDLYNLEHLYRIDYRLNQDYLVGAAVVYLRNGHVPYALGSTYFDAALNVVPRALWPDKPTSAGSGDLVAIYTGLSFMGDTSVGVGQVMETHINFGTTGVVVAFLFIGGILILVDTRASDALARGDIPNFLIWYMPGLSLLMLGGSFVEVSASAAALWIVARLFGTWLKTLGPGQQAPRPLLTRDAIDAPEA